MLVTHDPKRVFPIDGSTVSHHAIITLAICFAFGCPSATRVFDYRAPTLLHAPIAKPLQVGAAISGAL